MKLVMTLVVRDEADILDANLAFHLNAGVDLVVAIDHRSEDGTTEILKRYERAGFLHLIREESEDYRPSEWRTHLVRLAATDFEADWIVNSDADEFYWPRGGSLKDVLMTIPPRFGVLQAPIRHFFLRPEDGSFFSERMTARLVLNAAINAPGNPLRPNTHVLHRGDPEAVVGVGSHRVLGSPLVCLTGWHPVEVLHFPLRSVDQARRRHSLPARASTHGNVFEAHERGQLEEALQETVLKDDVLARGLAEGSLVIDTRLRDALRVLAGAEAEPVPGGAEFGPPGPEAPRLRFPRPSVVDDAAFAVEAAVLGEADTVRLQRRLDELERRLAALEGKPWRRALDGKGLRLRLRQLASGR
jgi:hypothetical protein